MTRTRPTPGQNASGRSRRHVRNVAVRAPRRGMRRAVSGAGRCCTSEGWRTAATSAGEVRSGPGARPRRSRPQSRTPGRQDPQGGDVAGGKRVAECWPRGGIGRLRDLELTGQLLDSARPVQRVEQGIAAKAEGDGDVAPRLGPDPVAVLGSSPGFLSYPGQLGSAFGGPASSMAGGSDHRADLFGYLGHDSLSRSTLSAGSD